MFFFQGKYYMFIETVSQSYRTVLPTIPWLHFLYDEPKSGKLIFSAILAVVYVILKVSVDGQMSTCFSKVINY